MTDKQMEVFYEAAVLPQFGIEPEAKLIWEASRRMGPDELAFRFNILGQRYILIFEDYFGLGQSPDFIEETLGLRPSMYEFVEPISAESKSNRPSYVGFALPVPYKYCEGVTGTFTLLKLTAAH